MAQGYNYVKEKRSVWTGGFVRDSTAFFGFRLARKTVVVNALALHPKGLYYNNGRKVPQKILDWD